MEFIALGVRVNGDAPAGRLYNYIERPMNAAVMVSRSDGLDDKKSGYFSENHLFQEA